jgi:hypothetical protein
MQQQLTPYGVMKAATTLFKFGWIDHNLLGLIYDQYDRKLDWKDESFRQAFMAMQESCLPVAAARDALYAEAKKEWHRRNPSPLPGIELEPVEEEVAGIFKAMPETNGPLKAANDERLREMGATLLDLIIKRVRFVNPTTEVRQLWREVNQQ